MNVLQIRLLGDFVLKYGGDLVTAVDSARLQSALTYLLLHSHAPQMRRYMAFQLWPDSSERQAHNNLRKVLHQLRQALSKVATGQARTADHWLHVDARTVHWQPDIPCTVDLFEFESKVRLAGDAAADSVEQQRLLAEAIALYQGDLLPSCYDEWIVPHRERLRQQLIEALERLIWLADDRRDYSASIHYAERLLHHDPLHEATYRRLMRLHMLAGNRAGALHAYHTCAALLQRELGVEPALETKQAHAQLLEMEIPTTQPGRPPRAEASVLRLVGRQPEWRTLRAAWQQATLGQPHFVLISGEAGIGKTRLAEELLTWADRQGIATARTRAYAAGQGLAYAPVVEWLQSKPLQRALAELDTSRLVQVARLWPDLLATRSDLTASALPATADLSQWQRQQLFAALTHVFLDSHEPKLLLIDDLQWCDGETLAWLRHLFSTLQNGAALPENRLQMLIMGTARPEEVDADHPLTDLLLDLRSANQVTEITLAPLNLAETAEIATQVADAALDAPAMQHIFSHTEGNPLFIVEMVRAGLTSSSKSSAGDLSAQQIAMAASSPTTLPPRVLAVIQSRLRRLSPGAHQVACIAAVIGRSFTFALLQAVSEADEGELVNFLDELWQRGIVRTYGGQTYDFSHDRIREVAYSEVGPIRMPRLHLQVAQTLETLDDEQNGVFSAQLADHCERAGEFERAIGYYQRAATVAHNRFADAEAASLLSHALALTSRVPEAMQRRELKLALLLQLQVPIRVVKGLLASELGDICTQANRLAYQLGRPRDQIKALSGLRSFEQMRGNHQAALRFAIQMHSLVDEILAKSPSPSTDDTQLLADARISLANAYFYSGRLVEARTYYNLLFANGKSETQLPIFSSMDLWLLGYPEQARSQMYQALVWAREFGHPYEIGFAMANLARLNLFLRRNQMAQLWAKRTVALCSSYQIPFWIKLGQLFLGRTWVESGETARGIELLQCTLSQLDEDGHQAFCSYFWGLLAEAYASAEQYTAAINALDQGLSYVDRNGEGMWHPELIRLRGEYLSAQDALVQQVEEYYQRAITIARQQSSKSLELRAAISLSRLWQKQGKSDEAYTLLSEIYNWFTEGFQTADLQAARNLLTELS